MHFTYFWPSQHNEQVFTLQVSKQSPKIINHFEERIQLLHSMYNIKACSNYSVHFEMLIVAFIKMRALVKNQKRVQGRIMVLLSRGFGLLKDRE